MAVHQTPAAHTSGGTMGKGGLAAGGDGGGSGGGEGAAVVGLDGLAILLAILYHRLRFDDVRR